MFALERVRRASDGSWREEAVPKRIDIVKTNQNYLAIPDFRNIGVMTKILMATILLVAIMPMLAGVRFGEKYLVWSFDFASWICPASMICLIVFIILNNWLHEVRFGKFITWLTATLIFGLCNYYFNFNPDHDLVPATLTVSFFIVLLMRHQALIQYSLVDSVTKARLNALTARIRPHFLFNSLNAAISLIRTKPTEAEIVLENLAELFREQLKDSSQISNLKKEIDLAKGYIQIEQFRMGPDRLKTSWSVSAPMDAQTPHLLLQPLLENAVYHGIEPSSKGGLIDVKIDFRKGWIYIVISNPIPENPPTRHREGNKMAMGNLIERLKLMFDSDALLATKEVDKAYQVIIRIPYKTEKLFNKKFVSK